MSETKKTSFLAEKFFPWLLGCAIAVGLLMFPGCGYGKVSYPTYQAATALYGACLAKSETRIEAVEELIATGNEEFDIEEISAEEHGWLAAVIQEARSGQWESAAAKAKRMMQDQNSSSDG